MKPGLCIWCVVALVASGAVVRAAESLRIVPIVHEGHVLVSVEVTGLDTEEVRETISSGLRTTFTYDVQLRMVVPVWVDRTIATAVIAVSDQYDNLTRRHTLSRTIDGRVEDTVVTEDEATARKWLTTLTRVPLCDTSKLDQNRDYYVRISAQVRPQRGSLVGWSSAITGSVRFTFIP